MVICDNTEMVETAEQLGVLPLEALLPFEDPF